MKTLIVIISLIVWACTAWAQYDTIVEPGTHFTLPVIPDESSYYIGVKNGIPIDNEIWLKLTDYQSGTVGWTLPGGDNDYSDSTHTHLPGHHNVAFKKTNNVTTYLDIYIRYYVDIVDSTVGSPTYGQMPDTVWVNPGESATLSAGQNFIYYRWGTIENSDYEWEGESLYSMTVPHGTYKVKMRDASSDTYFFSYDTIVVAELCYNSMAIIDTVICEGESITVGSDTYNESGTYVDTLINISGCDSVVITNLTVNPLPDADMQIFGFSACAPDSASIMMGNNENGTVYTIWDEVGNAVDVFIGNGTLAQIIGHYAPGTYHLTATNGCGTVGMEDTVTLENFPLPTVALYEDTMVVEFGQELNLYTSTTDVESYLWSTGETTSFITVTPLSDSTFYVTVTNGCGSSTDSVFVDVITSLPSLSKTSTSVHIYPNPTSDYLQIVGHDLTISKIEVSNLNGECVIGIVDFNPEKVINVSILPSGLYILKISSPDGFAQIHRFIKQ